MDHPYAPPSQVTEALGRGWTVLTANQRAARTLRHDFDRLKRALGLANWQPPAILAWETWTATLWRRLLLEGHGAALLLNPTQEHSLWREVIERDATSLRPVDSLAELAANAWHLLHAYRGRPRLNASTDSADTRAFSRWAMEFERRCTRLNYLTQAQLAEALREAFSNGHLKPEPGFLLVGFDAKTPGQTVLLEALQAAGAHIEEWRPERPGAPSIAASSRWVGLNPPDATDLATQLPEEFPPSATSFRTALIAAPDEQAELTACARWLRVRLTERPNSCLAVIAPAIEAERAGVDRTFLHILAPELEDIAAPPGSGPFEFSLGIPLTQTPMAATALDILRWVVAPLPLERIGALLLSPHFAASSSEHVARAEFDAFTLRRQHLLQPQISLDKLIELISYSKSSPHLPILLKHLRALRAFLRNIDLTAEHTHADWATTMHDLLEAAGWAAASRDNSIEFQTRRRWEDALDELATLDFDNRRVAFATALVSLERIAAQTLFAPESRHAPIQIMGPLESAGSTFDAIWFLRAGDLTWPTAPTPSPLLPWHLQRDLAMPGVNPARDSAHARRIAERIAASAPTVLFSYAEETPDGHQRPSPVLASLALESRSATEIAPAEPAPESVYLEALSDDTPIPPPPSHVLQGGAAILQSQAACGFRAFAEKRLFASALDTRELGLDPRERGSLVHDVLERFWAEVETQAALKLLPRTEREILLARSIDDALARHTTATAPTWNRAYIDTERRRLVNLLRPWLDYELTRPPFAVKSREEQLKDVQIGPLRLNIRVDRVDTSLADEKPAGEIILDYKTGPAKPADWLGDRPDAPQLPLYAVVSESPHLAAVAFASVRAGNAMELNGYEARKGVLPKSTRLKTGSLQEQVAEWREVLTSLAEDFHAGNARVSPKQYPSTCRYCEQRLLCRLDLTTLEADAIEDLTDDGDTEITDDIVETIRG